MVGIKKFILTFGAIWLLTETVAIARVYVSPYVSISSKKKIEPAKAGKAKETSKTAQRTTYGVKAGLSFWRLFNLQLSVGRSKLDKTEKVQDAADEFDEIDYEADLNMATDDPDAFIDTQEITDKARLSLILDPGFWILIARAKVGVQATKRSMTLTQNDVTTKTEPPITYKPIAGAGLGVRLTSRMKAMAEYTFVFYKFPETEPFEREVSISYQIAF